MEAFSFGLSVPNRAVLFGLDTNTLLQIAETADRSPAFDSVWVGDNFLSKPRLEAVVLLSALAARTRRVKLGTVCLATFPMRNPLQFAIQWSSLDVLASGRTTLAVCIGQSARDGAKFAAEQAAMGIRNDERTGRLEEGIELLRRFWTEAGVTHSGRFYQFADVDAQPKPVQDRVPIVIAANPWDAKDEPTKNRMMRRIARLADGWQTDGIPAEHFAVVWSRIREYAAEYGRAAEVRHASLHLMVNMNKDVRQGRREAIEFLDKYYGQGAIREEKLGAWIAAGPPDAISEVIDSYVHAGCTTLIVRFAGAEQERQVASFIEHIYPRFADRLASSPQLTVQ
jgi:alkanesulfonate monooxygenase SsuD/methylene tetrahydromethanopterin reductase-like flavin-dependent oxidoreductase (luciferase family)